MFFIYDNLSATVIGLTIISILMVMQVRLQRATYNRTIVYAAKTQAIDLGEWVQRDLALLGEDKTYVVPSPDTSGNTVSFTFRRKMSASASTPSVVNYTLTPGATVVIEGQAVRLYQLTRRVDGTVVGQSQPTLTRFRLFFLDENAAEVATAAQARLLRIQFSTAMPMETDGQYLRETYWGTIVPLY